MRSAFTLIELLVVIAIISVLAIVVILTLNPSQLLAQARDSNRLSDLASLSSAINLYITDQPGASLGSSSITYTSLPDATATTTAGTQCQGIGMPTSSATWFCGASSSYRSNAKLGWVPLSFTSMTAGAPLAQLPTDPVSQTSSNLYYTYQTNGSRYMVTAVLESTKYKSQLATSPVVPGYPEVAAQGSNLTLSALWSPQNLTGYWPLDEGTGTVATDQSGSGSVGTWSGALIGGTHYAGGKVGTYAGNFNGSDDYVNIGNIQGGATAFTWVAWIQTAQNVAGPPQYEIPMIMGVVQGSGATNDAELGSNGGVLAWYDELNGSGVNFNSSKTINDGLWHQVVVVRSGASLSFYVDGTSVGTATTGTNGLNALGFQIGKANFSLNRFFQGAEDDVRAYSRALSPAEVQALYNAQK